MHHTGCITNISLWQLWYKCQAIFPRGVFQETQTEHTTNGGTEGCRQVNLYHNPDTFIMLIQNDTG